MSVDANGSPLVIAVLAAGQGSRFNGIKQNANVSPMQNITLLQYVIRQVAPILVEQKTQKRLCEIVIILGAHHEKIAPFLSPILKAEQSAADIKVTINQDWQQGIASSIHQAVYVAKLRNAANLLITLGDQIGLTTDDYRQLIDIYEQTKQTTCSFYQQSCGVPAIFLPKDFPALLALSGDRGAKPYLSQLEQSELSTVILPNALVDIDTQADLYAYLGLDGPSVGNK